MDEKPVLGVIGGSGLYDFPDLKIIESVNPKTPFGFPSAPIIVGTLRDKKIAFLARHGVGHIFNPSKVNYRANIYALKMIGVEKIISISACGSLREDFSPGDIVVPDQLFDFTRARPRSFFDENLVGHVSTAKPFCDDLSSRLYQAVSSSGAIIHRGGQMITIEGPRFSTIGESNIFRSWGMSLIGMTTSPEAFLAREAEMCYTVMAHVTDYDVWHVNEEAVSVNMVIATLNKNTEVARISILALVDNLSTSSVCSCESALKDAIITNQKSISHESINKVKLLVSKYLK